MCPGRILDACTLVRAYIPFLDNHQGLILLLRQGLRFTEKQVLTAWINLPGSSPKFNQPSSVTKHVRKISLNISPTLGCFTRCWLLSIVAQNVYCGLKMV